MDEAQLRRWIKLFNCSKARAAALDIETTYRDGPISVLSITRQLPSGVFESTQFIQGVDLTAEAIRAELTGCELILTYNGQKHDLPFIQDQFPGALPEHIPTFDLYLFARALGMNTKLKVLEQTFSLKRQYPKDSTRKGTHQLWQDYQSGDEEALQNLLNYNRADARNLFPLAEQLIHLAQQQCDAKQWRIHQYCRAIESSLNQGNLQTT